MLGINLSQILETCIKDIYLNLKFLFQPCDSLSVHFCSNVPFLIKISAIEFRAQSNQQVALVNYQNSSRVAPISYIFGEMMPHIYNIVGFMCQFALQLALP